MFSIERLLSENSFNATAQTPHMSSAYRNSSSYFSKPHLGILMSTRQLEIPRELESLFALLFVCISSNSQSSTIPWMLVGSM